MSRDDNQLTDASSESKFVTWEEIELSESYLVAGMFSEASSLASSILRRLCNDEHADMVNDDVLHDMIESAAMVLVQSLKGSGRTTDLLNELKSDIRSITRIPVQVVLTGACIQVSDGFPSSVRDFIEDFLMNWHLEDGKYVASNPLSDPTSSHGGGFLVLGVGEYVKLANFYAVTLLGTVLKDLNLAITWVEKAQLPAETQQELLRKLQSLCSLQSTSPSPSSAGPPKMGSHIKEDNISDRSLIELNSRSLDQASGLKLSMSKWSQLLQHITQFRAITIKFGHAHVVISHGKVLKSCLILLICYVLQKKRDSIMRVATRRALQLKQALVDVWQLAFSHQVNPLAAVQSLPTPTHR